MANDLIRFSVTIPHDLLDRFDAYVEDRGVITNRSEVIRDLIRDALIEEEWAIPGELVVGTLTMVFDHHVIGSSGIMDEVEHDNSDVIISSMHIHLTHATCLEVIALRGEAIRIKELANKLLGLKGVINGHLTAASAGEGA